MMIITIVLLTCVSISLADKPCASRSVPGQSVVCVCNTTYCDDVIRQDPAQGTFVAYTSSKKGLRFHKTSGSLKQCHSSSQYAVDMTLDTDTTYQTIMGFGGAVTDAAGINWKTMIEKMQDALIRSYFGDSGLQYSFIRVPIGGSDFSTRGYAYNELPENDAALTNYTLAPEDYKYKLPMIRSAMKASSTPIHVVATTWSPPVWMKTNHDLRGISRIKPEYLQTYADYHLKFLKLYAAEGVKVWGITTTNEPINGVMPWIPINSLGWTPSLMAKWIDENLGPTIRDSPFNATKILAVDDQRYMVPIWFNWVVHNRPSVLKWVDGIAVHYYGDFITPPSVLDVVSRHNSKKFILGTEGCEGSFPFEKKVELGSWIRAKHYVLDIIQDLNHAIVGWIDWNLCLDPTGGPNWANNFVDSPILIYNEKKEFVKQPMFYAMGHFSKFIPRDSKRIDLSLHGSKLDSVAFVTPRNTVVAVIYNDESKAVAARLRVRGQEAVVTLPESSITTIEISPNPKEDFWDNALVN